MKFFYLAIIGIAFNLFSSDLRFDNSSENSSTKVKIIESNLKKNSLIVETNSIDHINNYLSQDTWYIFDIDNTMIRPKGNIGSDQWFCARMEKELNSGANAQDAVNKLLPIYHRVQKEIQVQPVENNVVKVIEDLQKNNHPTIALTFRSTELADVIKKQLNSVGIDLSKTSPSKQIHALEYEKMPVLFKEGIIMSNGKDKGSVFKLFIKKIANNLPKRIVCIDDKLKYVLSMKKIAEELGIEFVGIRYSYLDEIVKSYKLHPTEEIN